MFSAWVGALSAAVSRGSAPLVVGACRCTSTRLTAVIGGLVLALASLFTSFAVQVHQVLLRYTIHSQHPSIAAVTYLLAYNYGNDEAKRARKEPHLYVLHTSDTCHLFFSYTHRTTADCNYVEVFVHLERD